MEESEVEERRMVVSGVEENRMEASMMEERGLEERVWKREARNATQQG